MLSRVLGYAVFALAAWWAWTGPISDWRTVSPDEQLDANAAEMALCLRGKAYVEGAGGKFTRDPEASCASELNLYRHEGRWYSYTSARPRADGDRS